MAFKIRVTRSSAFHPTFIHSIELLRGEKVAGTALVHTNLRAGSNPHGHSRIYRFEAGTPYAARALHCAIAKTLSGLELDDKHTVGHPVSARRLEEVARHFSGFEQFKQKPGWRLLEMPLGRYKEEFKQRSLKELDGLGEFSGPLHFLEILNKYAAEVLDDKRQLKNEELKNERQRSAETFLRAVRRFMDPETNEIDYLKLTRHLHPNLRNLPDKALFKHNALTSIRQKVHELRKVPDSLPEKKKREKEAQVSIEGREMHWRLIGFFLSKGLSKYLDDTGITREEAEEIGLRVIDKLWAKHREIEHFPGYFKTSFTHALIDTAREMKKRVNIDDPSHIIENTPSAVQAEPAEDAGGISEEEIARRVLEIAMRRKISSKDLILWGLVHMRGRSLQRVGERFGVELTRIHTITRPLHQTFQRELRNLESE